MARLEDALRSNELSAAYCDTADNYCVIVEPKSQTRHPGDEIRYDEIRYLVRVEHGLVPPTEAYDAPDLPTAIALMRTLDLEDFDPETADWRSVDEHPRAGSAVRTVKLPTRSLPHCGAEHAPQKTHPA
jgi:hypothetical protein